MHTRRWRRLSFRRRAFTEATRIDECSVCGVDGDLKCKSLSQREVEQAGRCEDHATLHVDHKISVPIP